MELISMAEMSVVSSRKSKLEMEAKKGTRGPYISPFTHLKNLYGI